MPLPQIDDNRGIDRDAREIMQQQPAMRRRIGADALEADEIVVIEAFGLPVAETTVAARNPSLARSRKRCSP